MPDVHSHQARRERTQLVPRGAQSLGILGGLAWLAAWFLWEGGDDPVELALFWAGAVLVTLFLLELGTLLVKRGLLALRLFVACALPLLFWMVIAFVATAAGDDGVVWGLAGAGVAVFAAVLLVRAPRGATL